MRFHERALSRCCGSIESIGMSRRKHRIVSEAFGASFAMRHTCLPRAGEIPRHINRAVARRTPFPAPVKLPDVRDSHSLPNAVNLDFDVIHELMPRFL
ncbi:hypothetical protein NOVOSPHI9U_230014 [Novosphingobium sp. 9U]|nr:hypothetical protein NOVOSPHI9U_230014 [Novosphingobium sp. 9U]